MFIGEGEKVVSDLLASSLTVKKVFSTPAYSQKYKPEKKKSLTEWTEVTETELKKISALTTPHEVLAIAGIPSHPLDEDEIKNSLNLVLDDVSDPGNLGTIIRIADWFGIKNIICSADTADCYSPKVVQASMGSLFRVKVHYTDLQVFLKKNNQTTKAKVYGATLNGESIYSAELPSSCLIVLGNESRGVREELKAYFTHSVSIPSYSAEENTSAPDSLNVAVAAAVICAEIRRRFT